MIIGQPWQHAFIEVLCQHLANNEQALALVVFGTAKPSDTTIDAWSDVDLLLNHISPFSLPAIQEFEQMVNQFWYRSIQALQTK